MSDSKKTNSISLELTPLVSYWRSIALPVALVLVSVEVQRHWGSRAAPIYLIAGLLLGLAWAGTLLNHAWSQRVSGTVIDISVFLILVSGVVFVLLGPADVGTDILSSVLFWAPAICGWWSLSYYDQYGRVLIYAGLLYGGLYFLNYLESARHYYEYAVIGAMIIGLVRLVATGVATILKEALEKFRAQTLDASMRDPLTGVASKLYFEAELAHMSAVSNRYQFPFSLIILSIDGFENYVERHGESPAHELLKNVSWRIADRIRTPDTVCRLQSNEFAILLPNTSEPEAIAAAENIRTSISSIPSLENSKLNFHVAVGQHQFGEDSMSTFDLVCQRLSLSRQEAR